MKTTDPSDLKEFVDQLAEEVRELKFHRDALLQRQDRWIKNQVKLALRVRRLERELKRRVERIECEADWLFKPMAPAKPWVPGPKLDIRELDDCAEALRERFTKERVDDDSHKRRVYPHDAPLVPQLQKRVDALEEDAALACEGRHRIAARVSRLEAHRHETQQGERFTSRPVEPAHPGGIGKCSQRHYSEPRGLGGVIGPGYHPLPPNTEPPGRVVQYDRERGELSVLPEPPGSSTEQKPEDAISDLEQANGYIPGKRIENGVHYSAEDATSEPTRRECWEVATRDGRRFWFEHESIANDLLYRDQDLGRTKHRMVELGDGEEIVSKDDFGKQALTKLTTERDDAMKRYDSVARDRDSLRDQVTNLITERDKALSTARDREEHYSRIYEENQDIQRRLTEAESVSAGWFVTLAQQAERIKTLDRLLSEADARLPGSDDVVISKRELCSLQLAISGICQRHIFEMINDDSAGDRGEVRNDD